MRVAEMIEAVTVGVAVTVAVTVSATVAVTVAGMVVKDSLQLNGKFEKGCCELVTVKILDYERDLEIRSEGSEVDRRC